MRGGCFLNLRSQGLPASAPLFLLLSRPCACCAALLLGSITLSHTSGWLTRVFCAPLPHTPRSTQMQRAWWVPKTLLVTRNKGRGHTNVLPVLRRHGGVYICKSLLLVYLGRFSRPQTGFDGSCRDPHFTPSHICYCLAPVCRRQTKQKFLPNNCKV